MSDTELLNAMEELITTMNIANKEANKWIDSKTVDATTDKKVLDRLSNTIRNTNKEGKRVINDILIDQMDKNERQSCEIPLFTDKDTKVINMMRKYGSLPCIFVSGTPLTDTSKDMKELFELLNKQ